jgi:hypothetical protein
LGEFPKEKGFLGPLRATQSDKGVGSDQLFTKNRGGALVQPVDRPACDEGGVEKVNLLPKTAEGGMGIKGRGGEFDSHDSD